MADWLLGGKPVEAMIALIGRIATEELPGPIGIADSTQVLVIDEFGGPVRPHVEPSTRHTIPRTPCSMAPRVAPDELSMLAVVQFWDEMLSCRRGNASLGRWYSKGGPKRADGGAHVKL